MPRQHGQQCQQRRSRSRSRSQRCRHSWRTKRFNGFVALGMLFAQSKKLARSTRLIGPIHSQLKGRGSGEVGAAAAEWCGGGGWWRSWQMLQVLKAKINLSNIHYKPKVNINSININTQPHSNPSPLSLYTLPVALPWGIRCAVDWASFVQEQREGNWRGGAA